LSIPEPVQPKLREVRAQPTIHQGKRGIVLSDPLGISRMAIFIPQPLVPLLPLMDGTRDIGMLRTGFELRTGSALSTLNLEELIKALDEALLLDNERFTGAYHAAIAEYHSASYRAYTLPGRVCPSTPEELGAYLEQFLDQAETAPQPEGDIKGLICPHIDFQRGGPIYAAVWATVATTLRDVDLVVILGTDHNAPSSEVTLTRQSYQTPWGIMPTPQDVVDRIAAEAGDGVFTHELNHRGEHSVEAAALWLHYLLGDRPCSMLPVLCGSLQHLIDRGESPSSSGPISATAAVLKSAVAERRTILVAAADLAHVGPAFGDSMPFDAVARATLGRDDQALINVLATADAEQFFEAVRREGDRNRICGMPPIYLMLSVLSEVEGSATGYAQCPASEDGGSWVSICGMVYHSRKS